VTTLAHAALRPVRARTASGSRTLDVLLLTTAFFITFAKIRVSFGGGTHVLISDVTAPLFVAGFLAHRIARRDYVVSRTVAIAAGFALAFFLIWLVGFYNLETTQDRDLFLKGVAKSSIHLALVVCGIAYLERRSVRVYWQALGAFVAGMAANAAYGLLQLFLAETRGINLDEVVLGRLGLYEGSRIGIFGSVGGADVYRTNALTLDPNHLGVMLVVPILVVLPLYLRLERGHRLRGPLALVLGVLALAELSTLSRSGLLGLLVGLAVLAIPYRHFLWRRQLLVPAAVLGLVLLAVVAQRADFFRTILEARTQVGGSSVRAHLAFYGFVGPVLSEHPLFGLGLNTFAGYYERVMGREDYGPHSYYVAVVTETGIVGAALLGAWLAFVFARLARLRRLGRRLARNGDALAARVRPLGWGLTAALVGTMASNLFYLTMSMYYFYVFTMLALAAAVVFPRAPARSRASGPDRPDTVPR
jgi:O-antigen ligase